jgi:hypothetical protein
MCDELVFKSCDAGVVDQHVEPSEPIEDLRLRCAPLIFLAYVKGERERSGANLAGDVFSASCIQIADRNARAFFSESDRNRRANAACSASNVSDFAREAHVCPSFF